MAFRWAETLFLGDNNFMSDSKPPILKSWTNLYLLVIGFLAVLIVLFSLLTAGLK